MSENSVTEEAKTVKNACPTFIYLSRMSVFHIRVALIEEKVGIKTHEHNTGLSLFNIFIRRHANYS